jgi:hypothetical protein
VTTVTTPFVVSAHRLQRVVRCGGALWAMVPPR